MKTRPLLILALAMVLFGCTLCGCTAPFSYVFETIIAEDGSVLRTITFGTGIEKRTGGRTGR